MRKFMIVLLLFSLAASLTFGKSLAEMTKDVGLIPLPEGTAIVDFELESLHGEKIRLSGLNGKVIFLNFWATWCGPCRAEMPSMQKLSDRFLEKGLEIVAVDLQERKETVREFAEEFGLSFHVLLDTTGEVGAIYGARSIPTTYIVDRQGNVVAGTIGGREWDTPELLAYFEALLKN